MSMVDKGYGPRGGSPAGDRFDLGGFTGRGYDKGRGPRTQVLWLIVHSMVMRWWCPNGVRLAVLRMFGARIGDGALIRHGAQIHWPWKLVVGENSWIGEQAWILNLEPVHIGANTCISQGVLLGTGSHDRRSPTFEYDNGPISVGDSVWIAACAVVLRGVEIGDGATIGATALITRDVPAGSVVLAPEAQTWSGA